MNGLILATLLLSQFDMGGHVEVAQSVKASTFDMSGQISRVRGVMVTASWCGPCKTFKTHEVPRLVKSGWKVGSRDTDHLRVVEHDNPDYRASTLPTFIRLVDGKEVARHVGSMDAVQLAEFIYGSPTKASAAPTPGREVERVIGLLPRPEVGFVDFGCGDGRWCIAAAERWGCRVTGVEIDPVRAEATRERVRILGLDDLITIVTGDATKVEVQADVGVAYLYADVLQQLLPRLEKLRAFASYMHQPPGLPVSKNGDSWFYVRPMAQVRPHSAVWEGQYYSQPVCNNPGCSMCNSIRQQLSSLWWKLF